MFPADLKTRIDNLSPAKRSLLEKRLKESGYHLSDVPAIPRRKELGVAPLSFAQQRLWIIHQLEPDSSAYHEYTALHLTGELNVEALRQAIHRIVMRHEVLRTTFVMIDGSPAQKILDCRAVEIPRIDLRCHARESREEEAQRLMAETLARPFDLSRDLMLRLVLVQTDDREHFLLIVRHHIASDGWSASIFRREMSILYNAFVNHEQPSLPELPIQYADYAVWQRERIQGEALDTHLSYWRSQLAAAPALRLPADHPRPSNFSSRCAAESLALSRILSDQLRALSGREGATLFMTLLAAFQLLLHRYTGQVDVAVGAPIAGRTRAEIEGLIGFFVNTLVFKTEVSSNETFTELLKRVRSIVIEAFDHQELPFEKLVEELNPERVHSRAPLLQVMFALQNVPWLEFEMSGLAVNPVELASTTAKFDLYVAFIERAQELILRFEYSSELFEAVTIRRMMGHFQTLLESIVAHPDGEVGQLPIITENERRQLLVDWNETGREFPAAMCIHEIFEEQAKRSPGAIALVIENETVTYGQLNTKANQLAHALRAQGVRTDVRVGVCMERSVEMVIGLLGILKAGGAYVPLDPSYPKERLGFMLEDTLANVVLCDIVSLQSLPATSARVICLDRDWAEIGKEPGGNPGRRSTADNLAYVIYTSGSTGLPKGVEARHRGVVRLLFGVDYAQFGPTQTFLHLAPISFDAATFEVWGALLHGGKCVLSPGRVPAPRELGALLKQHGVNTLWLTAALFNAVIDEEPQALSDVRQLLIGGEALSVPHVKKALALLPETAIINGYGPTESTTFTCCYPIPRQLDDDLSSIPIGKPIRNTRVYILDPHSNPVPIGVEGELHIGGDGLARGYLNRPDLTAEKFIPNPFSTDPASRLYKTGDLARYRADGNIEFLGRTDNQIKLRGYRIELGEIESVLSQDSAVREAVVMVREDHPGEKQLVGYIVGKSPAGSTPIETRGYLKQKLPDYMVPTTFVFLNELPLTANGKVDRAALPVPDNGRPDLEEGYVAPRSVTEQRLALIWANVLKVERVGVHDNFFALGGHSLLAVRLLSLMTREMEREIPLRCLFESPTIAEIAEHYIDKEGIDGEALSRGSHAGGSHLFKLKGGEGKNPVFVFPGGFGGENEALVLAQIAHFVGREFPFYGLRARSSEGTQPGHESVEEMARDFIEEIKGIQPSGPYYLLGHCLGGVVAFEVACQLQDDGERVGLLGFLDTVRPTKKRYYRYLAWRLIETMIPNWQFYYRDRFLFHLEKVRTLGWQEKINYITRRSGTLREVFDLQTAKLSAEAASGPSLREIRGNQSSHIDALLRYRPRPYRGRLFSLVAEEILNQRKDDTLGWGRHVKGEIHVHRGTGSHESFIRDHIETVGALIRTWLEKVESEENKPTRLNHGAGGGA